MIEKLRIGGGILFPYGVPAPTRTGRRAGRARYMRRDGQCYCSPRAFSSRRRDQFDRERSVDAAVRILPI
jgi:hypothetical protein